jgi:hypothetical protein
MVILHVAPVQSAHKVYLSEIKHGTLRSQSHIGYTDSITPKTATLTHEYRQRTMATIIDDERP